MEYFFGAIFAPSQPSVRNATAESYGEVMTHQRINGAKNARRKPLTVQRIAQRGTDPSPAITKSRDVRASRRRSAFPSESEPLDSWHGSTFSYGSIVPSQFFTLPRQSHMFWKGEQRLLFAVLQEAVASWFRYRAVSTIRGRRRFDEVATWFESPDKSWLYAFERICEMLDLDPNYIRLGLQRWYSTTAIPQTLPNGVRRKASSRLSHGVA
jgi:hypothetical protein